MSENIIERLREGKLGGGKWLMVEAADRIEQLTEELDRYKYATGVLLTAFNSKWQSRTPAEVLRAVLEDKQ
jgi:hypothetical protein